MKNTTRTSTKRPAKSANDARRAALERALGEQRPASGQGYSRDADRGQVSPEAESPDADAASHSFPIVAGEAPASELTRFLQDLSQRHNLSQPAIAELLRKEVAERERNESHAKQPSLPDIAPEKWSARDLNRREAPPQFIERVYGPWLDGQLTRQGLKKLDSDLYRALSVWLSRHPDDTIAALLPRKRDILDEVLDRLSGEFSLEDLRKLGYAVDARLKRDAGTKKS